MARSIRWRLQAWYALVLLVVVTGFAGFLFYRVRAARFQEIDGGLEAGAQYLDAILRRLPPQPGMGPRPPAPPGSLRDEDGRPGFPPLPPPPGGQPPGSWEHLLAELELPRRPEQSGPEAAGERLFFAVWDENGELIKARNIPSQSGIADPGALPLSPQPRISQQGEFRLAKMGGPRQTRILVGQSVRRQQEELRTFAWQLAGAGALVLAIGLSGGWFVSARILRPVAAISATASAISAANLSGRIDATTLDEELLSLAQVLNAMFDRLEAAFERQARFTADASHELRTPLAILRSHAELSLSRPRSVEEYKETLEASLRAATRMTGLVEGLLTLARADAGKLDLERKVFDWRTVVQENIDLVRPLAESKSVNLTARSSEATPSAWGR
jgi:two-component system OmpR family sensor kinase